MINNYSKVLGGIFITIAALCGVPVAYLQIRKTRAEIKKLELEAKNMKATQDSFEAGNYRINISNSDRNIIQISADPRFLGPLLLLLDFIISIIIIVFVNYALSLFINGPIKTLVLIAISLFLFIPILITAIKIKKGFNNK